MSPSLIKYGAAALAVASGVASQALTYQLKESFTPANFFADDKWEFFVVCALWLSRRPGPSADPIDRASMTAHPRRETRPTALSTTEASQRPRS